MVQGGTHHLMESLPTAGDPYGVVVSEGRSNLAADFFAGRANRIAVAVEPGIGPQCQEHVGRVDRAVDQRGPSSKRYSR